MADEPTDDEPTDDELAAMAAAALLAVTKQRDRTHHQAAAALALVLAALKAGIDPGDTLLAIDPAATRAVNRAAVAADLARQARMFGVDLPWQTAARAAHTAATLAGSAAAAHVLSAGHVPVDPAESPYPDPFNPAAWIEAQQGGLAGDIVDAALRNIPDPIDPLLDPLGAALDAGAELGISEDELLNLINQGAGALYYLDMQVSDTYLDASTAVYLDMGLADLYWMALGDACPTCLGYEAGSPYTRAELPGVPHAHCRCWTAPH